MAADGHEHAGVGDSPECRACPVCALLQAVSSARPEVTEHLASAGRELALALQAVLDGYGAEARGDGTPIRRINID